MYAFECTGETFSEHVDAVDALFKLPARVRRDTHSDVIPIPFTADALREALRAATHLTLDSLSADALEANAPLLNFMQFRATLPDPRWRITISCYEIYVQHPRLLTFAISHGVKIDHAEVIRHGSLECLEVLAEHTHGTFDTALSEFARFTAAKFLDTYGCFDAHLALRTAIALHEREFIDFCLDRGCSAADCANIAIEYDAVEGIAAAVDRQPDLKHAMMRPACKHDAGRVVQWLAVHGERISRYVFAAACTHPDLAVELIEAGSVRDIPATEVLDAVLEAHLREHTALLCEHTAHLRERAAHLREHTAHLRKLMLAVREHTRCELTPRQFRSVAFCGAPEDIGCVVRIFRYTPDVEEIAQLTAKQCRAVILAMDTIPDEIAHASYKHHGRAALLALLERGTGVPWSVVSLARTRLEIGLIEQNCSRRDIPRAPAITFRKSKVEGNKWRIGIGSADQSRADQSIGGPQSVSF